MRRQFFAYPGQDFSHYDRVKIWRLASDLDFYDTASKQLFARSNYQDTFGFFINFRDEIAPSFEIVDEIPIASAYRISNVYFEGFICWAFDLKEEIWMFLIPIVRKLLNNKVHIPPPLVNN